ncbi:MAG TPA: galactose oxidase early set domain-containing protein [Ignavibacteria bacterium]|nr:galactose oxidase early set domain-containing protein [Ignavibacteria bacterium]
MGIVLSDPSDTDSDALDSQQEAVHMCLLPTSSEGQMKILYFAAFTPEEENEEEVIKTRILTITTSDPPLGITDQTIPNWPGDSEPLPRLFCCGHTYLQDGKLLCAGGHRETPSPHVHFGLGLKFAYVFDPDNETWDYLRNQDSQPQKMDDGRWYPTVTNLGTVSEERPYIALVIAGYRYELDGEDPVYNDNIEAFNPEAAIPEDFIEAEVNYPGAHLIPYNNEEFGILKGEVFYSFPLAKKWRFNPYGNENSDIFWTEMPESQLARFSGASVLLPLKPNNTDMKVLILGGKYDVEELPADTVEVFNLGATTQEDFEWKEMANLNIPRMLVNTVILPDGKLFVMGGSQANPRQNGITLPEIYDPEANSGLGESKLLPCASTFTRMYHSTGILLLDGSVLVSGGELQEDDTFANGNRNFEIYKPPYLFDGSRPNVWVNTTDMTYGTSFYCHSDLQIAEFILIKPGVPTHGFDPDQRAIYLEIVDSYPNDGITYVISGPADGFVAPPGKYLLFAVRPKNASTSGQNKIPSMGIFINLFVG